MIVDLRRWDARIRSGRGRMARMYHDVDLGCVGAAAERFDFLFWAADLDPIFV